MMKTTPRIDRRLDALSKERIVELAIKILDEDGEAALTFRSLASRLATGSGAIYWHVANKSDLLAAAAETVISQAMASAVEALGPKETIRAVALGMFDAMDAHPWIGTQLAMDPAQHGILRLFESIGGQLQPLGVPEHALFNVWSTLINYILGVAGQNAANARQSSDETSREEALSKIAAHWVKLDPEAYPFLRRIAGQLPGHDDREQFLAGIDLILSGLPKLQSND